MSQLELIRGHRNEVPPGASDEWFTPGWVFRPAHRLWRFQLDVCASAENAKCERFFDFKADGLSQQWDVTWFGNFPFSHIEPWVWAAFVAAQEGVAGLALVPAWTDRPWWQEAIEPHRDKRHSMDDVLIESKFVRRIQFGYSGNPDGDRALCRRDKAPGAQIYPVFLSFVPPGQRGGLLALYEPEWPHTTNGRK